MALSGKTGLVEGTDYSGARVVSVLMPVPGSPWFMVAKVEAEEVFAEWRQRARLILLLGLGMTVTVLGLGVIAWQRASRRQLRVLYRLEAERRAVAEQHSMTLKSIGDAVIATDASGRVELMNPVAESLTAWTESDARGRPLADVFRIVNEETRSPIDDPVTSVLRDGVAVTLSNHTVLIARDGVRTADRRFGRADPRRRRHRHRRRAGVPRSDRRAREGPRPAGEPRPAPRIAAHRGARQLRPGLRTGRWTSSDVLDPVFGIDAAFDRSVEGWMGLIQPDDRVTMASLLLQRGRRPRPAVRQGVPDRPATRRSRALGVRAREAHVRRPQVPIRCTAPCGTSPRRKRLQQAIERRIVALTPPAGAGRRRRRSTNCSTSTSSSVSRTSSPRRRAWRRS